MVEKIDKKEIEEVFDKLQIVPKNPTSNFQVWEVPPIQKGTHISVNTN